MDACSDTGIAEVGIMSGAQLGKAEALLNVIGLHMEHSPTSIPVLQPTLEMGQAFSKDRLTGSLMESTPELQGKVRAAKSRGE